MKIKFIIKSWGATPEVALKNSKKYFPNNDVTNIVIRQITEESVPDWNVEGEYEQL